MWPKTKLSSMTPILMHCAPLPWSEVTEVPTSQYISLSWPNISIRGPIQWHRPLINNGRGNFYTIARPPQVIRRPCLLPCALVQPTIFTTYITNYGQRPNLDRHFNKKMKSLLSELCTFLDFSSYFDISLYYMVRLASPAGLASCAFY